MLKNLPPRRRRRVFPITYHLSLITIVLLAGCSMPKILEGGAKASYFDNDLRYEHPFTDAAFESARKDAERECTSRKRVAIKSPGACTMDRCVTNYVCVTKADAAEYNR